MDREKRSVIIFGAGPLFLPTKFHESLQQADLVIAADGGANHCAYLDIFPDHVIGDLDSIDPQLLGIYQNKNITIQRYPKDKDTTDLELAMDLALQEGAEEVYLFGVLGKRWDMSLANIMLAAGDKYKDIKVSLFSDHSIIRVHHPQKTYILKSKQGQSISFLSLNTEVTNVSLQGFAYPLNDENLRFGSTRGISNIITGNQATEKHQTGILLCVEHI